MTAAPSQIQTASVLTRGLAKEYRGILALAEAVREIGDVELAVAEVKQRHKQAADDLADLYQEVDRAKQELEHLQATLQEKQREIASAARRADAVSKLAAKPQHEGE